MKKKAVPSLLLATVLIIFTLALFKDEILVLLADDEQQRISLGAIQVEVSHQKPSITVQIPLRHDFKLEFEKPNDRKLIDIVLFPRSTDDATSDPKPILKKAGTYTENDFWGPLRGIAFQLAKPTERTVAVTVHLLPYKTLPHPK